MNWITTSQLQSSKPTVSDIPVLFSHPDFYIVAKPVGVTMHDAQHGIVTLLRNQLQESALYLCHRLDDGTSGCLLLARNQRAAAALSELFATQQIQKFYIALAQGKPKKKQGTVKGDMINRRRGQHILTKTCDNPAITQFFSHSIAPGLRGYIVRPLTGKTHQIRVALKSVGAPILGDTLYGKDSADRLYLHALRICFTYQGATYSVSCPVSAGQAFLSQAGQQWLRTLSEPEYLPWPNVKGKAGVN
ncbi:TIGR01621 family pseudouridine synthase [Salinimonas profundi]|uniref:TIGR01621 family pseudouridine synthase n=1 Tax=Salinimonas profundi TaxID=2729140 RepID=UPI001CC2DBB5